MIVTGFPDSLPSPFISEPLTFQPSEWLAALDNCFLGPGLCPSPEALSHCMRLSLFPRKAGPWSGKPKNIRAFRLGSVWKLLGKRTFHL